MSKVAARQQGDQRQGSNATGGSDAGAGGEDGDGGAILGLLPRTRLPAMDRPSVSQPALRTVEIAPPSARAETWNVLRVAALIVLATWIYIADTAAPAGTRNFRRNVCPLIERWTLDVGRWTFSGFA